MNINWTEAYNRLMDIINAGGETKAPEYFSGGRFLNVLASVDYSLPRNYSKYIKQRQDQGLSTSRKDFFEDILDDLNPVVRVRAYKAIITELESANPDGLNNLKAIFGANTPQVIKKKKVPESSLSNEMYFDIIDTIYHYMRNIENKPSIFKGKGEEALRDLILLGLENKYEKTTATGETFNKGGKTDILLKKDTGENLFIGECKIWHGIKEFHQAINQLFDNYITWRDSKTALIIFVKQKGITHVVETIKQSIKDHKYYIREVRVRHSSLIQYEFQHKDDSNVKINLEVMIFHYPDVEMAKEAIEKRRNSNGEIVLKGFYQEEGFEKDIFDYSIGDRFMGRVGTESVLSVSLFNQDGQLVGGLYNASGLPYLVFEEALREVIDGNSFDAELLKFLDQRGVTERKEFLIKIIE